MKDLITNDNHVVVSEYTPRLPWLARNAMQRNKTICGLSNAVVVIESGLKGGTFEAGKAALLLRRPLLLRSMPSLPSQRKGMPIFSSRVQDSCARKMERPILMNSFRRSKRTKPISRRNMSARMTRSQRKPVMKSNN